ncbi:hypothetical protein DAC20_110 [Bacteroides phage DAC20]|nr:hypothetical protein DAC16_103 [Bacteroides phage DAC16]QIG63602.1 hypothetical protein DAC19_111 [Bacteroides phage DAC19]QIG63863.1 hypothetical protein DAC20_110 [Bacteroides phage DAC20]QIG64383.1 hypothetical protein DAC23_105 [Bacteroides phage DAC23]
MTIFRNIINKQLYVIEHLIYDIRFLNNNQFAGYYAYPFMSNNKKVLYFKDSLFLNNFVKVSER